MEHPDLLIVAGYKKFVKKDKFSSPIIYENETVVEEKKYEKLFDNGYLWNKIFKSEIIQIENLQMENFKRREDLLFVMQYSKFVQGVFFSNKCIYNYRQHEQSSSSKLNELTVDSYLVSKKIQKIVPKEIPFQQALKSEIYSSIAIYLLKLYKVDDENFEKMWQIYLKEEKITFLDFKCMNVKRKIWYLIFLLKKHNLIRYQARIK